jgi:hypothetical protein
MEPNECPLEKLEEIEGEQEASPGLFGMRLKKAITTRLAPGLKRRLKRYRNRILQRVSGRASGGGASVVLQIAPPAGQETSAAAAEVPRSTPGLQPGDLVRVRSREQIDAMLDARDRLKGLRFMPEMAPYCGTRQRVFKRLDRFFDEAKLTVKNTSGVVLLEGLFCQGVEKVGRCDRSCFFFWREEWLERIEDASDR